MSRALERLPHGSSYRIKPRLLVSTLLAVLATGCSSPARPSVRGLTLALPASVQARYVTCATCGPAIWLFAEFPVVVGDPDGAGGTLATVETTAVNTTRGGALAHNTRPNADYAYTRTTVPAGGTLEVLAGIVIAPPPPPRDAVSINVLVTLADGRKSVGSSPLTVVVE
jgi:hypothetical protein